MIAIIDANPKINLKATFSSLKNICPVNTDIGIRKARKAKMPKKFEFILTFDHAIAKEVNVSKVKKKLLFFATILSIYITKARTNFLSPLRKDHNNRARVKHNFIFLTV